MNKYFEVYASYRDDDLDDLNQIALPVCAASEMEARESMFDLLSDYGDNILILDVFQISFAKYTKLLEGSKCTVGSYL